MKIGVSILFWCEYAKRRPKNLTNRHSESCNSSRNIWSVVQLLTHC
uniref:Uncharacterized protein n=1 Tax=Arundo donax TaxID=35708 RepID=A0A0A8ZY63_ARUDO